MTIRTTVTTAAMALAVLVNSTGRPAHAEPCDDMMKALRTLAERFNIIKPEGALSRCASLGRLSWSMWSLRDVTLACQGSTPVGKAQSETFESMGKAIDAQIEGQCK